MRAVLAILILSSGCFERGERAASCPEFSSDCQTKCPAGETCSPNTPDGLSFGGATLGDAWLPVNQAPMVTARGGTQTIRINGIFPLPFEADPSGPAFSVVSAGPDSVVIRGDAAGTAELRIVDPSTGELYDRLALDVAEATGVSFRARAYLDGQAPGLLWGAGGLEAVVALDGGGGRLADESMSFALPPSGAADTNAWDTFSIADPLPQPFSMDVTLGDGTSLTASTNVAYDADHLEFLPVVSPPPSDGLQAGDGGGFPFRASAGGLAIAGAPFAAQASGAIAVEFVEGNLVDIHALQPGTGHLTVSVGSAHLDYDVPVSPAPSNAAPPVRPHATPAPAPGERAQMAAAD